MTKKKLSMRAIGRMTSSMAREFCLILIVIRNGKVIKGNLRKDCLMGKDYLNLLIIESFRENLKMVFNMEME